MSLIRRTAESKRRPIPSQFKWPQFKIYRQTLYWFDIKEPVAPYLPDRLPVFIWELGAHPDDFIYGFPVIDGSGVKVAS